MRTILVVDVETTGLDREHDEVIEVGWVLWSVEHRTMLDVRSALLPAKSNPAEAVNGIPEAALADGDASVWRDFERRASLADALVAHQADFDRAFIERYATTSKPWVCTREDMRWPRAAAGTSLTHTALAHGCAVVAAHRAVNDCLLLVRLLESVADVDERLDAALAHAKLPKVRVVSLAPYEERETVKAHGFKWDPQRRQWWRVMAIEDAADFPFSVKAQP